MPDAKEKAFAELFDKYNLLTLPVVDDNKKLKGVITPDDVISLLRATLTRVGASVPARADRSWCCRTSGTLAPTLMI